MYQSHKIHTLYQCHFLYLILNIYYVDNSLIGIFNLTGYTILTSKGSSHFPFQVFTVSISVLFHIGNEDRKVVDISLCSINNLACWWRNRKDHGATKGDKSSGQHEHCNQVKWHSTKCWGITLQYRQFSLLAAPEGGSQINKNGQISPSRKHECYHQISWWSTK